METTTGSTTTTKHTFVGVWASDFMSKNDDPTKRILMSRFSLIMSPEARAAYKALKQRQAEEEALRTGKPAESKYQEDENGAPLWFTSTQPDYLRTVCILGDKGIFEDRTQQQRIEAKIAKMQDGVLKTAVIQLRAQQLLQGPQAEHPLVPSVLAKLTGTKAPAAQTPAEALAELEKVELTDLPLGSE